MRVLIVTPRYLPETGGVERHVYETASRFAAQGVEVTVLTTDRTRQRARVEVLDGVTIRRVPAWPRERDYYLAPGIYRGVTDAPWDVVHVQSWHTPVAPLAMLAALRRGIPLVVTPHGRGYASRVRQPWRPLQRRSLGPLLRRAHRVIALARFERENLVHELRISPERIAVISNGSDLRPPAERPQPADGAVIASVGRLERFKGHHRILEALPHIIEARPDSRLLILGEGPYEHALRTRAHELGVADRVTIRFLPMAERDRLAAALASVSLVVLLSEYETHPIAALEAAAMGTPVLVSDVGGLKEFAEEGLGRGVSLSIPPGRLADAVLEELEAPTVPPPLHLTTWDECAHSLLEVYAHAGDGCRAGRPGVTRPSR